MNPAVLVWSANDSENNASIFSAYAENRVVTRSTIAVVAAKTFYSAPITGLKPNTKYNLRCGAAEEMREVRSFKTAPDNRGQYTFLYMSDSQASGNHSRAWQANLDIAKAMYPEASFIYIAGDLTNTAQNEGQWESFFNQPGNAFLYHVGNTGNSRDFKPVIGFA